MSPGVLLRAGMAGQVVGLDWKAAEVLMPRDPEAREPILQLLRDWEAGLLEGVGEKAEKPKG